MTERAGLEGTRKGDTWHVGSLLGKGMMESGGKSSRKCKRGETKIFSVFKKQKSEVVNVIGLERGWGGLRRGWSLEGKKGRKSDVERKISLRPKKRKQG